MLLAVCTLICEGFATRASTLVLEACCVARQGRANQLPNIVCTRVVSGMQVVRSKTSRWLSLIVLSLPHHLWDLAPSWVLHPICGMIGDILSPAASVVGCLPNRQSEGDTAKHVCADRRILSFTAALILIR